MSGRRYVIAGGSGLVGRALARALGEREADLVILTRSPEAYRGPGQAAAWDGRRLGPWQQELEGAAGVINLTGRNVNTRWTAVARREILESRVNSASVIGEALAQCVNPPGVWVNAGGVGIYGDRGDEVLDESAPPAPAGADFLTDVCRAWESAVNASPAPPGIRRVILRYGAIFSGEGGALPTLARVTRLFAGGRLGSGRQWMPWIHIDDAIRATRRAMENEASDGTYNVTSPQPVTNQQLMIALRRALRRPPVPPAPAWLARIGAGILGLPIEPALASTRAVPGRLEAEGFVFDHPELEEALGSLLGR